MKRLLCFLIFASSLLGAQENNHLVLQFIDENIGKKVGAGVCIELIFEANCYIDSVKNISSDQWEAREDYFYEGDIMCFDSVLFADSTYIENHIAIVYHIGEGDAFYLAQQNVYYDSPDTKELFFRGDMYPVYSDSKVVITEMNMSSIVSGKVSFYKF